MGKKILLADDSITIQKVIELTFSDEDFDVVTVGNGRLALERLPEVRPDIVLCDIIMPERDGYEVCEQVKSNPAWSHLPVLLLTGAFEPFDQERAARAGYDGSLAKPFEPETLIAKVKELLARAPRAASPAVRPSATDTAAAMPVPSFVSPVAAAPAPPPAPPVASVLPASAPPASAPPASAPAQPYASAFIPEEPFVEPAAPPSPEPLADISDEESATLSAPAFEEPANDSVSTVMFRASDLPWAQSPPGPAGPPPAPAPVPTVAPPPAAPSAPVTLPPVTDEPLFIEEAPAPADSDTVPPPMPAGPEEEPQVFEAVLEEDLEFGAQEFATEAGPVAETIEESPEPIEEEAAPLEEPVEEEIFAPELTARGPFEGSEDGSSGAFAALVQDHGAVEESPASDTASFPGSAVRLPTPPSEPPVRSGPAGGAVETATASFDEEEEFPPPSEAESPLEEPILEEAPFEEQPGPSTAAWHAEAPSLSLEPPLASPPPEEIGDVTVPPTPALPEPAGAIAPPPVDELGAPEEEPLDMDWPEEPVEEPATGGLEPPAVPPVPEPSRPLEPAPTPAPRAEADAANFGDVADELSFEEPQPPASEAAALGVPVEMVEKIAQRVVAQISEKAVREIAWEVIPDLAEALIKQEIEKLKAELAKL